MSDDTDAYSIDGWFLKIQYDSHDKSTYCMTNYNVIKEGVHLSLWLKGKKSGFLVGSRDGWRHRYLQYWRLVSHGFNMILTSSLTYHIWQLWSRKEWHKRGRRALWRALFESSLVLLFRLGEPVSFGIISNHYVVQLLNIKSNRLYRPSVSPNFSGKSS